MWRIRGDHPFRRALALACGVGLLAIPGVSAARSSGSATMVALGGNVLRDVQRWSSLGAVPASQRVSVGVGLTRPDRGGEAAFTAEVSDPSSPEYHHFLTPAQFNARFGVSTARLQSATDWL